MNILSEFETGAARWPNDIAIVHSGKQIRYVELDDAVKVLTAEFHRLGIEPGDKVGLLFPNGPEHVAATLAIVGIGAVVVFLSPLSSAAEIAALAEEISLEAICFVERFGGYLASCPGSATGKVNLFNGQDPVAVWQRP